MSKWVIGRRISKVLKINQFEHVTINLATRYTCESSIDMGEVHCRIYCHFRRHHSMSRRHFTNNASLVNGLQIRFYEIIRHLGSYSSLVFPYIVPLLKISMGQDNFHYIHGLRSRSPMSCVDHAADVIYVIKPGRFNCKTQSYHELMHRWSSGMDK